jgi:ligand-binding sensor domain-containing protein
MDLVDPHGKGARVRTAARGVLVLLLAACAQAAGATLPIRFDRFDQESGLSQLAVNAIAQDAAGFLWLGTEDGLDQFDGYTFHPSRHDRLDKASLSNNFIADLETGTDGSLWVATDGGGVVRRNPVSGAFERIALPGLQRVRALRLDRAGRLWIAGREGGLASFDPATRHIARYRHAANDASTLPSNSLFAILEDRRGDIWIGTEKGLARFDTASRRIVREQIAGTRDVLVRALLEDQAGRIWIGTYAGLVRFDPVTRETVRFSQESLPSDTVDALLEDSDRRLWVGTTAGLALFDAARQAFDIYRNDAARTACRTIASRRCTRIAAASSGSAPSSVASRAGIRAPGPSATERTATRWRSRRTATGACGSAPSEPGSRSSIAPLASRRPCASAIRA